MEPNIDPFLDAWHQIMIFGGIVLALLSVFLYLFYQIRVSLVKGYKSRYDFITQNEISYYKKVSYVFGGSVFMWANLYGMGDIDEIGLWFFMRIFIGIALGTLIAYITSLILDYYYPSVLDKKLKRLRYATRTNPETGNRMRLLSEDEEDVHLDEGMQAEENVFSIDYDVWIDEKTGKTLIEKYPGRLQALQCGSCGFYTMKIVREEITREATEKADGELIKHYKCTYCKSVRATAFNIARKKNYAELKPEELKFRPNKTIALVSLEVHSVFGEKKHFEFQDIEETKKFLEEFDFDKSK